MVEVDVFHLLQHSMIYRRALLEPNCSVLLLAATMKQNRKCRLTNFQQQQKLQIEHALPFPHRPSILGKYHRNLRF
jgi:hypothetical protein